MPTAVDEIRLDESWSCDDSTGSVSKGRVAGLMVAGLSPTGCFGAGSDLCTRDYSAGT